MPSQSQSIKGWVLHTGCPADLEGRLRKAPGMKGVQNFEASAFGLRPLRLETWGHLIFLNFGKAGKPHGTGPLA